MSEAVLAASAPPARARAWRFRHLLLALNVAAVAAVSLLWWASTRFGWVAPIFLPAPGDVLHAARLTLANGDLLTDIVVSARRVFLGFALAAVVAVPLGIVMGVWRPAKAIMDPFVSLLRPLPSITWIPLTILWLGIGEAQKVAIVFMGS
jgi:taurine transport system permease protein